MDDRMTRDEAIARFGLENVDRLEHEMCEPTNRQYIHADGEIEWAAEVKIGDGVWLEAVYYTDDDDAEKVEQCGGDWGVVDWEIAFYRVR